jgi:hypothetical protein
MRLCGCKRVTLVLLLTAAAAFALVGLLGEALDIGEPIMFATALMTLCALVLMRHNIRKVYLRALRRRRRRATTEAV